MIPFTTGALLAFTVYTSYRWYQYLSLRSRLRDIPTIGGDGFVASYLSAWKGAIGGQHTVIEEGYKKYPNASFKIPTLFSPSGWIIIVNGSELFEDIRKAPIDQLSFRYAAADLLQSDHLAGIKTYTQPYHINAIRVSLTRGYAARFAELKEEVAASFEEMFPAGPDWTSYPLNNTLIHVISRSSNRILVGLPLCRNKEYLTLNEDYAIHMFKTAAFLQLLPHVMRPMMAKLLSKDPAINRTLLKYLEPIIQERIDKDEQLGVKREGKPNDLISWLLDSAPPQLRIARDIVQRLMVINLASIHTTTMTTTQAIFHLAANPQFIEPLRAEVQETVDTYGWTKEATNKMVKLDSFLKESSRVGGVGAVSLTRRVLQDFQFSNGMVIPAGCTVAIASHARHSDGAIYADPEKFDAFRFLSKGDSPSGDADSGELRGSPMVTLDDKFGLFGHGRFACPGRFFAVSEIKTMVGHLLLEYDVKLPGDQTEGPKGRWNGPGYAPNRTAHILLRRRSKV